MCSEVNIYVDVSEKYYGIWTMAWCHFSLPYIVNADIQIISLTHKTYIYIYSYIYTQSTCAEHAGKCIGIPPAFSALLAFCEGHSPVTSEFSSQRPVTRSSGVFFDLCLNKRLSKQSRRRWYFNVHRTSDIRLHCLISAMLFITGLSTPFV